MLIQLTQVQITNYWEIIKRAMQESLRMESSSDIRYQDILAGLLSRKLLCLMGVREDTAEARADPDLLGIVTVLMDYISNSRSLYILGVTNGGRPVEDAVWGGYIMDIKNLARGAECRAVTAVSCVPRIINLAEQTGATMEQLIKWEV